MSGSYDLRLVGLASLVAVAMCYTGFESTERIIMARGRMRAVWLACGTVVVGVGLWASDYLNLLAFQVPVSIRYYYPTLILGLVVAIFMALTALSATSQARRGIGRAIAASVVVGITRAAVPLLGIAALRLPLSVEYRWELDAITGGCAIVIFLLILVLMFAILYRRDPRVSGKLIGALIVGSAIVALPYLSMATVRFHPSNLAVDLRYTISRSWLGVVCLSGTSLLLSTGTIIASILQRMLESEQAIAGTARHAELQFRTLAEAIPQIVWTASPDGLTTYINRHWYDMTGTAVEGSLGSGWMEAVHPDDRNACHEKWKESLRTGEPFELEYRLHDARKGFRWYLDRAVPLRDTSGKIIKWFGTCTDIDDQMHTQQLLEEQIKEHVAALFEANQRLQEESIHDPLTGLYNRRYLEDSLQRETRLAARVQQGLGIIMFDLDHFKRFNDTYGHDAGDAVLRETAALLLKNVRAEDIVCRYGGEEFVIILPMAGFQIAFDRAERICQKVHELDLLYRGESVGKITISAGVAGFPEHGLVPAHLLRAADDALYRAKHEGRDRVVAAADGQHGATSGSKSAGAG